MQMQSLTCNNCGAPLQVPESANYVTCNHCETQLVIHRTKDVTFTDKLDQLARTTDKLTEDVSRLVQQNKLDQLERQWAAEREKYFGTSKQGQKYMPSAGQMALGGVVAVGIGIVWTVMMASSDAPIFVPLFGLAVIASGVINTFRAVQKTQAYKAAQRRYQVERSRLLADEEVG